MEPSKSIRDRWTAGQSSRLELSAARQGSRYRAAAKRFRQPRTAATRSQDGPRRRAYPQRVHRWRYFYRDDIMNGDHLGREHGNFRRRRLAFRLTFSTSATIGTHTRRGILSALFWQGAAGERDKCGHELKWPRIRHPGIHLRRGRTTVMSSNKKPPRNCKPWRAAQAGGRRICAAWQKCRR